MTREEILHMAREAGLHLYVNDIAEEPYALRLERFADLVAAAVGKRQRRKIEDLIESLKEMIELWEDDPAYGADIVKKARWVIAEAEGA